MQANGQDALEEKLNRLARKPGVKASVVIDRSSGSILKTSGDLSALRTSKSRNESTAASFSNEAPAAEESESKGLEDFAALVWNYVNMSGQLVQDMEADVRRLVASKITHGGFRLISCTGRVEATTAAHEETRDRDCARSEIPSHSHPRYASRLSVEIRTKSCGTFGLCWIYAASILSELDSQEKGGMVFRLQRFFGYA